METGDKIFGKFEDETGEEFYCPVDAVADQRVVSEWEIQDCVEASTVGRYSGNINVTNRFDT
jgi:hypothetical protein